MTKKQFENLDDSIESFELIKKLSEKRWKSIENKSSRGKLVKGLIWREGLSTSEIIDFENKIGFTFPEALKNFYKVMNGLAIENNDLSDNEEYSFYQGLFRSYPEDFNLIIQNELCALNSFNISKESKILKRIPNIFNYCGNRFLILDQNKQVLSIREDAIFYGENLAKALSKDIFQDFMDTKTEHLQKYKFVNGWLEEKYWD